MSRTFWRRLRGAARDDMISEAGARLLPPFTPISMLKMLFRRWGLIPGQLGEDAFLHLRPTELKEFYTGVANWLELPWGDEMRHIPLVAAVDWTSDRRAAERVQVERDDKTFQMSPTLLELTQPALRDYEVFLSDRDRKPLRDDYNLRVRRWDPADSVVCLQPVSYLDSVRTNYSMDYKHAGLSLRERIHSNGHLHALGESALADHLGVEVLLFSAEGHLVLGERGRELAVTAGRLGPAGAGALKREDLRGEHPISLAQLPLLRELFEETALNDRVIDPENVHILGIVRDLLRGGKPQLSLAVGCCLRSDQIVTGLEAAETAYEHRKLVAHDVGLGGGLDECLHIDRVRAKLGQLLVQHGDRMTEPLLGALALWWRSLTAVAGTVLASPNRPMHPADYLGG